MLFYGTLASHHLLQKELQEVTDGIFFGRLREIREEWERVFFQEMYELLELKLNPQDRSEQVKDDYLDQALDAAENRHLNRM